MKLTKPKHVLYPPRHVVSDFLIEACKSDQKLLAIDLESTGLDPHSGEITIVGMSYDGENVLLVHPRDLPVDMFNTVMEDPAICKVFHNAKFDMKWLMQKFGTKFINADCTYVMRRLLTTGYERARADLATVSYEYLGLVMTKETREDFIGQTTITEEMAEYAALDVYATWHLHPILCEKIKEEELLEVYAIIEKPLISVVADMELFGIDVDLEYLQQLRDMLERKIIRFQAELDDMVRYFGAMPTRQRKLLIKEKLARGIPRDEERYETVEEELFNVNSSKQVVHVLNTIGFSVKSGNKETLENPTYTPLSVAQAHKRLEKYGALKVHRKVVETKEKNPEDMTVEEKIAAIQAKLRSLDVSKPAQEIIEESIESTIEPLWSAGMTEDDTIKVAYDIVQRIQDLRSARKAVNGFIIPMMEQHINPVTGKVHTSFNQLDTATGRFSNREPNFQQMPSSRKDGVFEGFTFRRAFIPPPGYRMMIIDYQACEVRILAELTQDKNLIAAMGQEDPHLANASVMFGVPIDQVTKDMRTKAKTGIFTLVYGGGPKRIAAVLKCTVDEAREIMQKIFAAFPGVPRWIEAKKAAAIDKGYALSLSGRKRYFDKPRKPEYGGNNLSYADAIQQYKWAIGSIERKAQNAPVQATNADITKYAMVLVADRFPAHGAKLLLTIHDELVAIAPEETAEEAFRTMEAAMLEAQAEFLVQVEPKVDGKISTYWEH